MHQQLAIAFQLSFGMYEVKDAIADLPEGIGGIAIVAAIWTGVLTLLCCVVYWLPAICRTIWRWLIGRRYVDIGIGHISEA